jgi:hypothetical protein
VVTGLAAGVCFYGRNGKPNTAVIKVRELKGFSLPIVYLKRHDGPTVCGNFDAGDLSVKTLRGRYLSVGDGVR